MHRGRARLLSSWLQMFKPAVALLCVAYGGGHVFRYACVHAVKPYNALFNLQLTLNQLPCMETTALIRVWQGNDDVGVKCVSRTMSS